MRKHLRLNQIIRKDLQGTNQRKVWYPPEVVFIRRMHATCREDHEAGINKWDFEMTWGKGNIRRSEQKDLLWSGTSRDDMEGAEETKPHRLRWCSSGVLFDPIWSEVDEWMNEWMTESERWSQICQVWWTLEDWDPEWTSRRWLWWGTEPWYQKHWLACQWSLPLKHLFRWSFYNINITSSEIHLAPSSLVPQFQVSFFF